MVSHSVVHRTSSAAWRAQNPSSSARRLVVERRVADERRRLERLRRRELPVLRHECVDRVVLLLAHGGHRRTGAPVRPRGRPGWRARGPLVSRTGLCSGQPPPAALRQGDAGPRMASWRGGTMGGCRTCESRGGVSAAPISRWPLIDAVADTLGAQSPPRVDRRRRRGRVVPGFDLSDGRTVFAKTHRDPPRGFFTTEARGLTWLRRPGAVAVPEVLAVSDGGGAGPPFLVLEWIERGRPNARTDVNSGRVGRTASCRRAVVRPRGPEDDRKSGSPERPV